MRRLMICAALIATAPCWAAMEMTEGQLQNGLHYFVKENQEPAGKVELRLVVKVGSRHELKDEKGIAHLVEHMAFRRTRHFAPGEINAFFNAQGMRWGNDSNAWTNWEETVYHFTVNKSELPRALQLLADWGSGIEFDPKELATERQIVLDEQRMRENAQQFWMEYADALYPGREYSQHMPIGETEVIQSLALARIAAFYKRNYIAPRMSVIVVGDVAGLTTEALIKEKFKSIPAGPIPQTQPLPKATQTLQLFSQDRMEGLAKPIVSWGWVEEWNGIPSEEGMQRDYLRSLALQIVQRRLQALDGNVYSSASMYRDDNLPHVQQWTLVLDALPGKEKPALEALLFAAEQARRTGVSADELKEVMQLERANYQIKQVQNNQQLTDLLLNHVLQGFNTDTPQERLNRLNEQEKTATPESVQKALDELMKSPGQIVKIFRPRGDSSPHHGVFDNSDLIAIQTEVKQRSFRDGARKIKPVQLMAKQPSAGKIVSTEKIAGGGVWRLENGMEVIWQQAEAGEKQIGLHLRSKGGLLALPKKLQLAGAVLANYQSRVGLNGVNPLQLRDVLAGHTATLQPYVSIDEAGASGLAANEDLELVLQMLYLGLQKPATDHQQRQDVTDQLQGWLNQRNDLSALLAHGETWPWRNNWSASDFKLLTTADIQQAHAMLLGEPKNLRLVLTGIKNPAEVAPLIERYLASLEPAKERADLQPISAMPLKPLHVMGSIAQSEAFLNWRFVTPQKIGARDLVLASALADVIRQRLMPVLRFDGGLSYSVSSDAQVTPGEGVVLSLTNNGPAMQCKEMVAKTTGVLHELAKNGPSAAEVASSLDLANKQEQDRLQKPTFKAQRLSFNWIYGDSLRDLQPDFSQVLTQAKLKDAAQRWINYDAAYLYAQGCKHNFSNEELAAMWK